MTKEAIEAQKSSILVQLQQSIQEMLLNSLAQCQAEMVALKAELAAVKAVKE